MIAVGLLLAKGAWRDARLNVADLGVVLWLIAGAIGLIGSPAVLGSAATLHPLIALAYVAGRLDPRLESASLTLGLVARDRLSDDRRVP